jgi:hypothetical protein
MNFGFSDFQATALSMPERLAEGATLRCSLVVIQALA